MVLNAVETMKNSVFLDHCQRFMLQNNTFRASTRLLSRQIGDHQFNEFHYHLLDSHGRKIASGCDYTDLKEAFDKIDTKILLCKLSRLGFSNRLVWWFSTYLCGRSMCVRHGSYVSSPFISTSGVPQGNNLSPLLFLIFFNDVTTSLGFKCKLIYADDLQIYVLMIILSLDFDR